MKTAFSARQNAVLEAALRLLVQGGERALTTAAVAAAANCSKESLYKWFGDRDGLLAAIVTYQASKVRVFDDDAAPATPPSRKQTEAAARKARLEASLRDNLHKRKAQRRARHSDAAPPDTSADG